MEKNLTILNRQLTILMLFLSILGFTSCGNLKVVEKNVTHTIPIPPLSNIVINKLNCNKTKCLPSDGQLATVTENLIKKILSKHQVAFHSSDDSRSPASSYDFKFYIISAFENEIIPGAPRNLHIILKNGEGTELMQLGLAEDYSTPLTADYVDLSKIEKTLTDKLNEFLNSPLTAENSKN